MSNKINLEGRMYKVGECVYIGYTRINVYEQRGRRYVNYKRRQVNLNDIPILPKTEKPDPVFNYIFTGQSQSHSCPAMDYWIRRHRLKQNINTRIYKEKYL